MRQLSKSFIQALTSGFLSALTQRVVEDKDLDLEIRDNYLNIYFKGNSLLHLAEKDPGDYRVNIHEKFLQGHIIPDKLIDEANVAAFLEVIPYLKENIIIHGKPSIEVEYEQLIIRANNYERRNASEYSSSIASMCPAKAGGLT